MTLIDQRQKKLHFQKRRVFCLVLMSTAIFLLITRCMYLQIVKSEHYRTLAKQNRLSFIPISPARGLIYDRNGVLIADNIPVFNLTIIPEQASNIENTLDELSKIIQISTENRQQFMYALKHHRQFQAIPIRYKLTEREVAKFSVERYRFPGVQVQASLLRYYPLGETLVAALGYVGLINASDLSHLSVSNYAATTMIGKSGIEKYYEHILHGQTGYQEIEVNASGHTVRRLQKITPVAGANLHLTIDSRLQDIIMRAFNKKRGAAIAMDPNNGEILAFVSSPSYDPNHLVQGISSKAYAKLQNDPNLPLYNRALNGNYAIGSPIKPFMAIAGLRTHTITSETFIEDPGFFQVPHTHHRFRDWTPTGHGWVNLSKAIIVSCDTYFYHLAHQLGIRQIDNIMRDFGFGKRVGIDLPKEPPGLLPTPKWKRKHKNKPWYTGDTIVAGIGQGYWITTPIQMVNATAMLAQRGGHFRPHLLHHFQITEQPIDTIKPQTLPPLKISKHIWHVVLNAMQKVITSPQGTGRRHFGSDAPYSVAAKTGTVQHFGVKANQHYDADTIPERLKDDSTFIAFAPFQHPKIAIIVVLENNNEAPAIARKALNYYLLTKSKSEKNHAANTTHAS